MRVEEAFHVARSPEDVFDYVTDPSRLAEWQTTKTSVEPLTEGPPRLGTRVRERTKPPGAREFEQVVEFTEFDRPRRLRVHVVDGPQPIDGTWSFEPEAGGTRVRFAAVGSCAVRCACSGRWPGARSPGSSPATTARCGATSRRADPGPAGPGLRHRARAALARRYVVAPRPGTLAADPLARAAARVTRPSSRYRAASARPRPMSRGTRSGGRRRPDDAPRASTGGRRPPRAPRRRGGRAPGRSRPRRRSSAAGGRAGARAASPRRGRPQTAASCHRESPSPAPFAWSTSRRAALRAL